MDDISPVPHGTEGRPRPRSPPWRLGHQPVRSSKLPPKVCGTQGAFSQQPCRPFRHTCRSPRLLVLSKDRYTHLLFSVLCTIRSQLKFVFFFFFNYFYLPPPPFRPPRQNFQCVPPTPRGPPFPVPAAPARATPNTWSIVVFPSSSSHLPSIR